MARRILNYFLFSLATVFVALAIVYLHGYSKTPERWWYPFIAAVFTDHYTTGPFAMTSNTREDNPVWEQLPGFNQALARISYAMTRGQPRADVAWLFAEQEWKDVPTLPFGQLDPNANESAVSKILSASGLVYDRISRRALRQSSSSSQGLAVGDMQYQALLIDNLVITEPELLASIIALARAGVPVFWVGEWPARASGWSYHDQRDALVQQHTALLKTLVTVVADEQALATALNEHAIKPLLTPANGNSMALRTSQRRCGDSFLLLLFNPGNTPINADYQTTVAYQNAYLLNPETGEQVLVAANNDNKALPITIPAGRSRVLLLAGSSPAADWQLAHWQLPARSFYPYIRWWWPGNAVTRQELLSELDSLYQAGFGGVELQTLTIGFTFEQLKEQQELIYQVGSPAFFDNVKTVFAEAERLGMSVEMTLGSGWSSGGPFIEEHPEQQLLKTDFDVQGPTFFSGPLPLPQQPDYVTATNWIIKGTIGAFDQHPVLEAVIAATVDDSTEPATLSNFTNLGSAVQDGYLNWQVPAGQQRIFSLYRNQSSHNAVAAAYPGALERAPILDHLHPGGIEEYIRKLGQPWLAGLAPYKPQAWFVDSFELIGELPWTEDFGKTFIAMHGYDLTLYLPLVFMDKGESKYVNVVTPPALAYRADQQMAERIREDYELTRQQLFSEAFIKPLQRWTTEQAIAMRVQAHGGYGDYLDIYQLADIPEAEGLFAGGSFDFLKLASSAGHGSGAKIISSESFITMSLDFNSLLLDDYYWLAGNAYAAGINRLIYHGYAYHFPIGQ